MMSMILYKSNYVNMSHNYFIVMPVTPEQAEQLERITSTFAAHADDKLKKMFDDKKETPKLLIPKYLPAFVKSKNYMQFL